MIPGSITVRPSVIGGIIIRQPWNSGKLFPVEDLKEPGADGAATSLNKAVTNLVLFMVTAQLPVAFVQAFCHPAKLDPGLAVGVRVTEVSKA